MYSACKVSIIYVYLFFQKKGRGSDYWSLHRKVTFVFFSLIHMLVEEAAENRNDLELKLVTVCARSSRMYRRCVAICLPLHGGHLKTGSYFIVGDRHVLCGGH